MSANICNVRVAHIRPTYNNLHEWCKNPNNVYIGRKGAVFIDGVRYPLYNSLWHNPYKGEGAAELYRMYIINKIKKENLYDELEKLRGKNLGCWCVPNPCHGHVLLDLLENGVP